MNATARILAATLLLMLLLAGLALAKPPAPGGKDDPLVTKSYLDSQIGWKVQQVAAGAVLSFPTGCEIVAVSADKINAVALKDANLGECLLFDLTQGQRLGLMELPIGHHLLVGPGKAAKLTLAANGQLMVRGLPAAQGKSSK